MPNSDPWDRFVHPYLTLMSDSYMNTDLSVQFIVSFTDEIVAELRNCRNCFRLVYHKDPKFSDSRRLCFNLPKIQTKRQNLLIFRLKDSNGIANSEDPDQTAPLGAV